MKYVLYILVTVLLPVQLNAQTDSLINALKETASENTIEVDERIAAYNQLTTVYYNIDIKKARAYCKNAEQLAQTDTLSLGMCNVYVNRALLDFSKGFYNGAIEKLVKARKIAKKLNQRRLLITIYTRLSHIYGVIGYPSKGIKYNINAIEASEKIGDQLDRAICYHQIGNTYFALDEFQKSEFYLNKAIALCSDRQEDIKSAFIYIDIGRIFLEKMQWAKAEQSIKRGLQISLNLSSKRGVAHANFALAELFSSQQEYIKAKEYYLLSKKDYVELEAFLGVASVLRGLANIKIQLREFKSAEMYLIQALNYTKKSRSMVLAKLVYKDLSVLFAERGDYRRALRYYRNYSNVQDSVFNENKVREISEIEEKYKTQQLTRDNEEKTEKIKNQALKLDLSDKQLEIQQLRNIQNYYVIIGLIAGLLLMIVIGFLVFRQGTLKTKIRETELEQRALRSQMNPHFMFNSLNSIQSLIATDNNAEASIYLAKFSRLMRRILQNSREAYIPLRQEIEFLDNYIELEQRRFKETFDYSLNEDNIEDAHFVMIPPLVIQPFIENAIIHGLLRKSEKGGKLIVKFEDYNSSLMKCTIQDNGIGRKAAAEFKTDKNQESLGIKITEQRLKYLTIKQKIVEPFVNVIDLKDPTGKGVGTQVELLLPIKYKA